MTRGAGGGAGGAPGTQILTLLQFHPFIHPVNMYLLWAKSRAWHWAGYAGKQDTVRVLGPYFPPCPC